jgi:uncharacterized protein with HEPN domain
MSSHEVNKLLFDASKACDRISKFISGQTLDHFLTDDLLQSAVERQFEIIGEALNQALALDSTLSNSITNLNRIISFRHRLIHGYAHISPEIVWGIAIDDVPLLAEELRALLNPH